MSHVVAVIGTWKTFYDKNGQNTQRAMFVLFTECLREGDRNFPRFFHGGPRRPLLFRGV